MICPRCEGQKYDIDSCALCGNLGVLDDDGERIAQQRLWNSPRFRDLLDQAHGDGLSGRIAWRWAALRLPEQGV